MARTWVQRTELILDEPAGLESAPQVFHLVLEHIPVGRILRTPNEDGEEWEIEDLCRLDDFYTAGCRLVANAAGEIEQIQLFSRVVLDRWERERRGRAEMVRLSGRLGTLEKALADQVKELEGKSARLSEHKTALTKLLVAQKAELVKMDTALVARIIDLEEKGKVVTKGLQTVPSHRIDGTLFSRERRHLVVSCIV